MTLILHRQINHDYPVAVAGDGIYLEDKDGRRYLDASGGAAVSCVGHQHPSVIAAMHSQLDMLVYAHTAFFTSEPAEALGEHLIAHAPDNMEQVYLVSGGSEAVEASLKMARQYFVEIGQSERRRFISRRQSYHGNTLGALSVGGNAQRKAPFTPILSESHHIDPCYEYRYRLDGESLEEYGRRAADQLEAKILELGPETVAAFVAETVVGATLGAVPAAPGYFQRVREICDRYGVLLILDEVMCGMGRTGDLHACCAEGITPDLMTIAKGLSGGYAPMGAVFVSKQIVSAFRHGSGSFHHGHTYVGHPLACAAALAVQKLIQQERMLENVFKQGEQLEIALKKNLGGHPNVGDIRGRGLFWGVEFVSDKGRKTPFDTSFRLHSRLRANALKRGLIVYSMGGTVDGNSGDHVLIAPPFICNKTDVENIVGLLEESLESTICSS